MNLLRQFTTWRNRQLSRLLTWWSGCLVDHTLIVILSAAFFVVLFTLGNFFMRVEVSNDVLLTSRDDPALEYKANFEQTFKGMRPVVFLWTATNATGDIISSENMGDLMEFIAGVEGLTLADGRGLKDFCFMLFDADGNPACQVTSIQSYWKDAAVARNDKDPHSTLSKAKKGNCNELIDAKTALLGGVKMNEEGYLIESAVGVMTTFVLYEIVTVEEFESAVIEYTKEFRRTHPEADYTITYNLQMAFNEEIREEFMKTLPLFIVSLALMFSFTCLVLFQCNVISSQIGLGLLGILTVLLALASGLGLSAVFGIDLNPIAFQVLPFVILGIGIDNVYIITETFRSADPSLPIKERLAQTLSSSGYSVFVSSILMIFSFLVGSIIQLNAVSTLCKQLSVVVFCNFLLQFTLFSGFLVLDAKRIKAFRVDVLCCIKTPKTQLRTTEYAKRFFEKKYLRFLSWLPVQIFILLLLCGVVVLAGLSMRNLKNGMSPMDVVSVNSPLRDFFDNMGLFQNLIPFFVVYEGDVSSKEAQNEMLRMYEDIQDLPFVESAPIFWYLNFQSWLKFASDHSKEFRNNGYIVPEENFYDWLTEFLDGMGRCHRGDLVLNRENKTISSSRAIAFYKNLLDSEDYLQSITNAETFCEDASIEAYPFSFYFLFFSTLRSLIPDFVKSMSICLATTLFLGIAFLKSFSLGIVCELCTIVVVVVLFGFIPFLDILVNPIIVTNSVVAIGISTEFFINMIGAFRVCKLAPGAKAPEYPLFGTIAVSLSASAISSILSLLPLYFADTPIISVYFFVVYMIILTTAYLMAIVVLPVILLLMIRIRLLRPEVLSNEEEGQLSNEISLGSLMSGDEEEEIPIEYEGEGTTRLL